MSLLNKASLIQIPSGYKDGKLYSAKPTNGDGDFTFSRGSNLAATRVNSDGLIEKGRENLLLQSNTFNTTWSTTNASVTSGQSGYDGTNDAWLLDESAAGGRVFQSISGSGVMTFSMYVKSGSLDYVLIYVNTTSSDPYAYFDLANGLVGNTSAEIDAKIVSAGNGYYRCSVTGNVGTLSAIEIYPANSTSNHTTAAGSIYIQDAQLELGLVATDYIETGASTAQAGILEDMPRLDYSGGATCPSLLLEPQRTNALPHSEWIGGWTAANSATIDGVQSFTLPSSLSRIQAGSIGNPSGDFVFYAVFDSADIGKTIKLAYYDVTAAGWNQGTDITIDSNGRAERTISTGSNIVGNVAFYGKSTSESYTLKYCQFEAGSYPTSYIPTYGASVTRGADGAEVTSASGIIGQTQGVIFIEFVYVPFAFDMRVGISDGTSANYNNLRITSGGTLYVLGANSSVLQYEINAGALTGGETYKVALKYNTNDIEIFVNGISKGTDTSASPAACDRFGFDNRAIGQNPLFSNIKQTILFPTALSDDECIQLTTL